MSTAPASSSPFNLEFLRKDAKHLLKMCRAGNRSTTARIQAALPRMATLTPEEIAATITLADVHHAIAREHGCANWAALKRVGDPLERLLVAARGGALDTITSSLHDFAALPHQSAHAACVLGHADALASHLEDDPAIATLPHRGWPPIAYVCASPIHRLGGRHSAGLLACATMLLDRGVDPNTTTSSASDEDRAIPIAYRAIIGQNMAIYFLLQRRGLDEHMLLPFRQDLTRALTQNEWQSVMTEYMQRPAIREALVKRVAEWRAAHPEFGGHFTLLDLREMHEGAWEQSPLSMPWIEVPRWTIPVDRPGSIDAVMTAITHHGPSEMVELLLDRGFDPSVRHPSGRSLVAMSVRAGRESIVNLLQSRGASMADVAPADRVIGACMRLDGDRARAIVREHPDAMSSLAAPDFDVLAAAARASLDHLRLMLAIGMPPGGRGAGGVTALHVAAWHGRVEAVRLLIDHRAPRDARETIYGTTPLEWAVHGSKHCRTAEDEYRAVLEVLTAR